MRKVLFGFLILLVIGVAVFWLRDNLRKPGLVETRVCFGQSCFWVEVANTPEARAKGLMFRQSLPADRGMLFVFEQTGTYPFWMKNTLVPLDIIWLDENYHVVFVARNIQPCSADPCPNVNPPTAARYVLELNSGTADRIGLKTGDGLRIGN